MATPAPTPNPIITALSGSQQTRTTDAFAIRVSVYVLAPALGSKTARPVIKTTSGTTEVAGGSGTVPYVFTAPPGYTVPALTVITMAGDNEVVIVEELV